jgi:predicted ATPase/DNA-binding SARP family transcriptional activator
MRSKASPIPLKLYLLGSFHFDGTKGSMNLPARKVQSLLGYLIVHPGEHSREKLATLFWGNSLDARARDSLRTALKTLRKHFDDDLLLADRETVQLNPSFPLWADTREFEEQVTTAPHSAIALYRGDLLAGLADEWILPERERLRELYLNTLLRLAHDARTRGECAKTIALAKQVLALDAVNERAHQHLMFCYHASGDRAAALKQYEAYVRALRDELDVAPSPETSALYEEIKRAATAPFARETRLAHLPTPLTSFVGREKELKEIAKLLSSSRLLTLTGSGGVGKTRLAIQTAHDSLGKFQDGVFWVSLVGLTEENLIPQEIAQSLNVREPSQELLSETLQAHLKSKDLLIVLDNCEHLIRGCAHYAEQLLGACPRLKILATSIEALGLGNETTWQVPSLPLPEMLKALSPEELQAFASIELFVERTRAVKVNFRLTDQNSKSVAQICRRLDGIPLAIELAAARTKVLSVDEIAARLDNRFSLLTAGSRTAIPRHQTLRATIDWSFDLLTEPERILFRRLAIFAGGFTLDAAEAVCSQGELKRHDVLDVLGRLVDKSLVIVEQESSTGETHYRLLETIRQYALEKLVEMGEAPAIRDQHLGYYLALAEKSEPYIFSSEAAGWISRLGKELDNIRAAMDWSTNSGKADAALQIAGSLVYFWWARGLLASEWHDRVQQALARPEGREQTLARAKALNGIGFIYWVDASPTDIRPELEEALRIGRELGDRWNIATALRNLGLLDHMQGNYLEARTFLEQSLEIWRDMEAAGKLGYAMSLAFLGDVALNCNEAEWARSLYDESAAVLRAPELGDTNFLGYPIRRLGQLAWREANYENAISLCKESLKLNHEVGDPRGVMCCMAGFAAIAVAQGKFERAAKLMSAVETQLASMGIRLIYMDKMEYERNLGTLRGQLDDKILNKFWAKGKAMTMEEAIEYALEISSPN